MQTASAPHIPFAWITLVVMASLLGSSRDACAANLSASVIPIMNRCAAFGDPNCAGGQVSDPALAPVFSNDTSPNPGSLAVADKSYFDPRIGTANFTGGSAWAALGLLRTTASASVSSSPELGFGTPNLMRLGTISTARFSDTLTIQPTDPSFAGLVGTLTASIAVDGTLAVSGVNGNPVPNPMANADWRIAIGIQAPSPVGSRQFGSTGSFEPGFHGYQSVGADGSLTSAGLGPSGIVTFSTPIVLGAPFTLTVSFVSNAHGSLSAAVTPPLTSGIAVASAESIYVHTAVWSGIDGVSLGSLPVQYELVAPSGIDYRFRPDLDADGASDDADSCPYFASPDQTDRDGNGRGDGCECGDQNGDGTVDVLDLVEINRAIFDPTRVTALCDANGDALCNVSDIVAANVEIFSSTNTSTCGRQPNPGP